MAHSLPRDLTNEIGKYLPISYLQLYQAHEDRLKVDRRFVVPSLWVAKCQWLGYTPDQLENWYLGVLRNGSPLSPSLLCVKLCSWGGDIGQNSHLFIPLHFCISYAYNHKDHNLVKYFCDRITHEAGIELVTSSLEDPVGLAIIVSAIHRSADKYLFLPRFETTHISPAVKQFLRNWYIRSSKDFNINGNMEKYASYTKYNENMLVAFHSVDDASPYVKYLKSNPKELDNTISNMPYKSYKFVTQAMLIHDINIRADADPRAKTGMFKTALKYIKPHIVNQLINMVPANKVQKCLDEILVAPINITSKTIEEVKELILGLELLPNFDASKYILQLNCLLDNEEFALSEGATYTPNLLHNLALLLRSTANVVKLRKFNSCFGEGGMTRIFHADGSEVPLIPSTIYYNIVETILTLGEGRVRTLKVYYNNLWQNREYFKIIETYTLIVKTLLEYAPDDVAVMVDKYGLWPGFTGKLDIKLTTNPPELGLRTHPGVRASHWPELALLLKLDPKLVVPLYSAVAKQAEKYFGREYFSISDQGFTTEVKYLLNRVNK